MKKTMMKILLAALPAVMTVSCKPTLKVSSDYDRHVNFSRYKTYSLYYLLSNRNVTELNEERIWNSIRATMAKKGYVENNQNPDLVVNAVSVVKNKKFVTANSAGYGYGPYGYWGGRFGGVSGTTTFQTNNFREGSMVIDVIDRKTNKLVWEGVGSAEFDKKPKNPDEAIHEAVGKILSSFPQGNAGI